MIGGHEVLALGRRDDCAERLPCFGHDLAGAIFVQPALFRLTGKEHAAQDEFGYPGRISLRIGEGKRRPPAAAEHLPAGMAGHLAQPLDIVNDGPGIVRLERSKRGRPAASALIEQQDVVEGRVPLTSMTGTHSAAGTAMKKNRRLRAFCPDPFPVEGVTVADIQHSAVERFDLGIEFAARLNRRREGHGS